MKNLCRVEARQIQLVAQITIRLCRVQIAPVHKVLNRKRLSKPHNVLDKVRDFMSITTKLGGAEMLIGDLS
ncbi:MAG: hypothetical protein AAF729_10685 [Pseudomonadota bacterium]